MNKLHRGFYCRLQRSCRLSYMLMIIYALACLAMKRRKSSRCSSLTRHIHTHAVFLTSGCKFPLSFHTLAAAPRGEHRWRPRGDRRHMSNIPYPGGSGVPEVKTDQRRPYKGATAPAACLHLHSDSLMEDIRPVRL